MKRLLIAAMWIVISLCISGVDCFGQTTQPSEIFSQVLSKYDSMSSYSSSGTITSDMETTAMKVQMTTTFTIKMKKPNQYLITWSQFNQMMPVFVSSGTVWNDGSGAYLYMGMMKTYSKMDSDQMALAAATGVSGGAANTIPSFFLPAANLIGNPFRRLEHPQVVGSEALDGDDCYKISGSSRMSKEETYWISKSSHLIRKYSRSMEMPPGGREMPQMSDADIDSMLKASNQPVTAASRQQMRDQMKQMQEQMRTLKGSTTEVQTQIGSPDLKAADFDFKVPEGVKLGDSPFGGAAGGEFHYSATRVAPAASEPEGGL